MNSRRTLLASGVAVVALSLTLFGVAGAATTTRTGSCTFSDNGTNNIVTCPSVRTTVTATKTVPGPTVTVTATASVSPTTTSPPTIPASTPPVAGVNCLANPSGCGYPDATNTGTTGSLTAINGDLHTTTDGQTIQNVDIHGTLFIDNSNVTISNVKVESPSGDWDIEVGYSATATHPLTGIVVQDCTLDGALKAGGGIEDPLGYATWTVKRCNISNGENGVRVAGHALVQDNYVHDLKGSSSGHFDDLECYAGTGNVIDHNTMTLAVGTGYTSAVNLQGDFQAVNNTTLSNNLLDGGGYTLNIRGIGANPVSNTSITGNRLGAHHAYGYSADDATNTTATGNVADATGQNIDAQI